MRGCMHPNRLSTEMMGSVLNQHRLAVALKFSVIAAAVIALYSQDLGMVFTGALTNESTYQILAVPFLFGYLVFRKRKMVAAALEANQTGTRAIQKYFSTLAGVSLFAAATLTYWWGSYTFTPLEYHMLTMPFLVAGLILILFNTQTLRQLLFPVAFLIFITPPPDEILYGFGSALANLSASASNAFANLFGMHATLSSSNVGPVITLLRPGNLALPFNIDVACSGIYSIIGFSIFALFIAYITRGKLLNKLAILIMGIPLIMVLNIIRITTILGIGYSYGENLALTLFHGISSTVLIFLGTLLLFGITEKIFEKPVLIAPCPTCTATPTKPTETSCPNCGKLLKFPKIKLHSTDVAKIVSIILITVVLLSIQVPVFALTKSPPQVLLQTPQGIKINTATSMLPTIQGYNLNYIYQDTDFEQQSGDEAALVYAYSQPNSTTSTVWIAVQIAASVTSEHRWETCLINFPLSQGNPSTVNQVDLRDIQLQDNPPVTARYFVFQYKDTNQSQVVLYWYETAMFATNNTAQTKSVMISLVMYPLSPQNITAVENQELPVALAINGYWQPIQSWSSAALAMSENGLAFSVAFSVILVALVLYMLFYNRNEKKQLLNLYSKLSEQNKNVVKAVEKAQKQGNATIDGIADELTKLANSQIDRAWLTEKLLEAGTAGLIKKVVVNVEDEPTVQWINQTPITATPHSLLVF